jgi:2-dehydropantoate 2-reductase
MYIEKLFTRLIPATAAHRSSMLQDITKGRKTEIDALNGAVFKMADEMGLKVPVNQMLTSLIKAKEAIPNI